MASKISRFAQLIHTTGEINVTNIFSHNIMTDQRRQDLVENTLNCEMFLSLGSIHMNVL